MTPKLEPGDVVSTLPSVVENGVPALIALVSRVGAIPARNAAANDTPCSAASIFRDHNNETKNRIS
jgi:hypothetical protein